MAVRKIVEDVYEVGAIDWDRKIFDELIPLPDGTSYNSYVVFGKDKTALIDTVDPSKEEILLNNLRKLKVGRIDYVISNHAEQDHSGTIPRILEMYPKAKVVTNKKAKQFLMDLLHIPDEKFIIVEEGEKLALGGKTLEFYMTPWVHWPETMVTYLSEDRIVFTCDFFGSHLATSELMVREDMRVYEAAKRYYAEIMMPFRVAIRKNVGKIKMLNPKIIAPSHGPIYEKPEFIIKAYEEWISDDVKNLVVIIYVSMHGSTEKMVSYMADLLMERGVEVRLFNLPKSDIGEYAISLVDTATLIIASPIVLGGLHPVASFGVSLVGKLRPKLKNVAIIGSYGWGGRMVDEVKEALSNFKVKIFDPVIIKGLPRDN
ncbi:MAG: FprA family A-type flavoprotein, partial [Thermotoga sp.]